MKKIIEYSKRNTLLFFLFVIVKKYRNDFLSWKYDETKIIEKNYKRGTGKSLNLKNPLRYTEKIQWLKINYRNSAMNMCADKYSVRKFVKDKGLGHLLNEIIAVYNHPSEINLDELPGKFVLKTTHSSGWNIICTNKEKLKQNWFWWKKILNIWINEDYSKYYQEWHYKGIQPRIICEKFIGDNNSGINDYKFFCFHGEIKLVQVDVERYSGHKQNYYDDNWNYVPMTADALQHFDEGEHKPAFFEEMKKISKILAEDFPFCRVDLFEWDKKIYFGELTFFDGSGYYKIEPEEFDFKMGEWLQLPLK